MSGAVSQPSRADTAVSSSLPLPPLQFYSLYGDESRLRGRAPPRPPPPPASHHTYSMFGSAFCAEDPIIQPLENQDIRRLYPINFDHRKELKKLNHSVLANFLDLLEILIRCPDSSRRVEKLDDMKLLFIHMHHLINEFRPHQAREALRVTLHLQKRKRLEIADKFQAHLDRVVETVSAALQNLSQSDVLDSKLLVGLSISSDSDQPAAAEPESEDVRLDALLCSIVDNMS